ncbi:MAG: urease accessory protein UreD [Pseudomonadota bacterium]
MFAAGSPSDALDGAPALQRVDGEARVVFKRGAAGATRLADLYQRGAAKIRLPNTHDGLAEAVLLNASGGVTEGDRLAYGVGLEAGAAAVVATQAAERVYRAPRDSGAARIRNTVTLGPGARLDWLAQETILFDRGRLDRSLSVEMAEDAAFLGFEPLVFGREAMGESVGRGFLSDRWRIRRGGRLIYADATRLEGDIAAILARPSALGGRRAMASLVYVAPDAADRLEPLRAIFAELRGAGADDEPGCGDMFASAAPLAAASAWNSVLSARLTAPSGGSLMVFAAAALQAFRGAPTPRVWRC